MVHAIFKWGTFQSTSDDVASAIGYSIKALNDRDTANRVPSHAAPQPVRSGFSKRQQTFFV